jgi:hypothetical protein
MGIPGSGKSIIRKESSWFLDAQFYLESEESNYPDEIKENFSHLKEIGPALNVYKYFRNIRVEILSTAIQNKMHGISSVFDCFYGRHLR